MNPEDSFTERPPLRRPPHRQAEAGGCGVKRGTVAAESGATLVEFAMTAGIVFLFVIGGMDLVRFGFFTVTAQQALNRAARQASVGTTGDNPDSKKSPEERANDIATSIISIGQSFGVNLSEGTASVCPLPGLDSTVVPCPPNNAGKHGEFVTIVWHQPFHFVWQTWTYTLHLHAIAKNEPF